MGSDGDRISYLAGQGGRELDAAERADLDEVRELLADPTAWSEPTPELEDRVVAAVGSVSGEQAAPTDQLSSLRRRRRFTPTRVALPGAAAVAIPTRAALAAAAAAAIVIVALAFAIYGADDPTTQFALSGTSLQPSAEGSVRVTPDSSGLRIELDATGLPRRDDGRYYQAWLRSDTGDLVPIGTFHDPDDVVLWAGVSLRDYPTLTVTEEETNSDPASSGRRVLVGTADVDA
jgi:hypothetical protein